MNVSASTCVTEAVELANQKAASLLAFWEDHCSVMLTCRYRTFRIVSIHEENKMSNWCRWVLCLFFNVANCLLLRLYAYISISSVILLLSSGARFCQQNASTPIVTAAVGITQIINIRLKIRVLMGLYAYSVAFACVKEVVGSWAGSILHFWVST